MIGRIKCWLYGHYGFQSQQNKDGSWTTPRCVRCGQEEEA